MSECWVGGDLAGLQAIGTTMAPAPGLIDGVVRALGATVDSLATDAGWYGEAADAFRKAWAENAIQAGGLAAVVAQVGGTLGGLGDTLQKIENDLYDAANQAAGQGAQIGARGVPATLVITGDPAAPAAMTARAAQSDYATIYSQAMQTAQGYRLQAANALSTTAEQIAPGAGLKPDQAVTIADYLRGLYAIPNEGNAAARAALPGKIGDAQSELRDARKDLRTEMAAYDAKGLHVPSTNPAALAHSAAVRDIADLRDGLKAAEAGKGELPASTLLNTKLGDAAELLKAGKLLPESLSFLRDVPVLDVAASVAIGELQARDDEQKGWSGTEARVKDYAAAGVGLAAGVAVVAASVPADAVVAGVLVAGGAVIGVGDVAYQAFHEHWSEDIHDDGVVGGLAYGSGHVLSNSVHDLADMGKGIGNTAASVWHGVFG